MQKITTFLWFNDQAEQAANDYVALFPDSSIDAVTRYGAAGPGPAGSVMTVAFKLAGQTYTALNGGPHFQFTPAISQVIHCESQEEVDHYWDKLGAGGAPNQCGWLTDKYGLSWQVVPTILPRLLASGDPKKSQSMMKAMMGMTKLDIQKLQDAYDAG
jgi:predicted 3-demethylubiquinone-9 3-methyltransferase (glyoxalase superfamily)